MCSIALTEFRGVTGPGGGPFTGPGSPPYIRVSGTITGCAPPQPGWRPTVSIGTTCGPVEHGISVSAAGTFTFDIENREHCLCGTNRSVTITCDADPTCFQTFTIVLTCGKDEIPPICPPGSPLSPTITFTEAACNAAGQRDVTAQVTVNAGWTLSLIEWSWDGTAATPSVPPTNATSPPRSLSSGVTHSLVATATLAAPNSTCRYAVPTQIPVTACPNIPPTTTPPPTTSTPTTTPTTSVTPTTPTTTPTTTGTPTVTPTSTGTSTSTPTSTATTPPSSSTLCGLLLAIALILLALAAVSLAVGGCLGPIGLPIIAQGLTLGAAGLVALALWIAVCRDCRVMRFLQRFFGAMALFMLILAAALSLVGLLPCSGGAAAVAALFGAIVGVVSIGIAILNCP
jgi:hypothetical protein